MEEQINQRKQIEITTQEFVDFTNAYSVFVGVVSTTASVNSPVVEHASNIMRGIMEKMMPDGLNGEDTGHV